MSPLQVLAGILLGTCLCSTGVRAQDRTSEAGEATITDPNAECQPYNDPVASAAAPLFPVIWEPATILANDSVALAKWNSISSSVPTDVKVKGSIDGDFSNTTSTYPSDDPDCWWTQTVCTTPKHPGLTPDIITVPEPNSLGYGFDDGPNCSHNVFYDFLASQNQKATMYFIGSNVMDWPSEARRAVVDGHEICAHTWSHHYMTAFSSADAFAELYYSVSETVVTLVGLIYLLLYKMQAIKIITGVTPTCWRPPFGDVDDRIRAIAKGLGLRTIVWSYDTNDWEEGTGNITAATIDANYEVIINNAKNGVYNTSGTIVLFHELDNFTMSEAIKMYPLLKAAFSHLVPVGVGYNITQPYVETNYSQPTFEQYIAGTLTTTGNTTNASSSASSSSSGTSTGIQSQSTTSSNLNAAQHLNVLQDGGVLVAMALLLEGATLLL